MNIPLFFTFQGTIIGNGYAAEISLMGRVLATPESDGVWLYGVNPGAIAADGPSLDAANDAMKESLRYVFVDFAKDATTFDEFKAQVKAFIDASDDETVNDWNEAVAFVRANSDKVMSDLPRRPADTKIFVIVEPKTTEQLTTQMNYGIQPMATPAATSGAASQANPPLSTAA